MTEITSRAGRFRTRLPWIALLAALALVSPARAQQPDDDEDDPKDNKADNMRGQVVFADENFDQWIFQDGSGVFNPRRRLDQLLALRLDDIDRACRLTREQRRKLELTARGDVKRFFVLYEKVKRKFQLVKNDQQKMQEIWRDINPLQSMMQSGMFDDDSLLVKSLHNTLTPEQFARYDAASRDRRMARHRAHVELGVLVLEQNMPLREDQRRELITQLTKLTRPSRSGTASGYYVLMYQMSQLPEEKLKTLFDDGQWKVMSKQINQFKQWGVWLRQSGQLDLDEDDADKAEPKPAAKK
jgi:hypothetical protein